jgi:hypothetical protein
MRNYACTVPYMQPTLMALRQWSNFAFHGLRTVKYKANSSIALQSSKYNYHATGWRTGESEFNFLRGTILNVSIRNRVRAGSGAD